MTENESRETTSTGKWRKPGVPHKGWRCVDIEEFDEQDHLCEMCESRLVRFVHVMEHPTYAEVLSVGCICAGHMEQNIEAARQREATFKSARARRQKWLTRRWRTSNKRNDYLNVDGFNVVVFPKGNGWGARVSDNLRNKQRASRKIYATANEAKLKAFDVMLWMKENPD